MSEATCADYKESKVTNRSIVHGSFTLIRIYDAPVARVFQAFADQDAKSKWFAGPPGWKLVKRVFDFREGGREHLSGRFDNGTVTSFDCIYHDIVENERIIYSYVMEMSGRRISVSQASLQFKPEGKGTRFTITEYGDFLDGYDDAGSREHGTGQLLDMLGKSLEV
ncbi:MAG TPA: SRPBCC family protein [Rhizomicrobium sp.]|nr:SRPBCC family protein [Rhizomicrobium sp.]